MEMYRYYKLVESVPKEKCWQHNRIDCPVWFCKMRKGDRNKPITANKELAK
jgi:hypothetical protein